MPVNTPPGVFDQNQHAAGIIVNKKPGPGWISHLSRGARYPLILLRGNIVNRTYGTHKNP